METNSASGAWVDRHGAGSVVGPFCSAISRPDNHGARWLDGFAVDSFWIPVSGDSETDWGPVYCVACAANSPLMPCSLFLVDIQRFDYHMF